MSFDQPIVRPVLVADRQMYELIEPYAYSWAGRRIRLPATFTYDGASVPRIFWTATGLRPGGAYMLGPSAVHDALYRENGVLPSCYYAEHVRGVWRPRVGRFTRKEADQLFLRMMGEADVPKLRRKVAYWGVRIGNVGRHWAG